VSLKKQFTGEFDLFFRKHDLGLRVLGNAPVHVDTPDGSYGDDAGRNGGPGICIKRDASTSERALAVRAFWTRDAEACSSSEASASCYSGLENVGILEVIEPPLKFIQLSGRYFLLTL
jgi:hypothetical protein